MARAALPQGLFRHPIHQRTGPPTYLIKNLNDIGHMGGKSAQALFNALFIADIRKNILKDAHFVP